MLTGLVIGALLAVELYEYGRRTVNADFGWYAYSPLDTDLSTGGGAQTSWPSLALIGAVVGLLVGAVVAAGLVLTARARSRRA